ncbi:uncharacterized protein EI90DRAFT_1679091 [Cantharellus anzutake]|uniref:uncharacterized protein n=1 Tax=Cantharellus anzutake TaxID=1750568 RepID=UPI0019069DEA|nr:uncharacterized protein EI90DRAFT_1679091 [Cantharellus anzutake]KAF8327735.1 hypothetical protein EI90DRAFT_1679091 [Cantharellus anzutake]
MSITSQQPQVVLVLCGLVGSGKVIIFVSASSHFLLFPLQSVFAQSLEHQYPNFLRCCQDELGSRRKVELAVRQALSEGRSIIVDRTNVDIRSKKDVAGYRG